ncbi:potassium channel family protein [Thalassomonas sp. M1454]|uniref:potassium channel family protein n=1 Tax=Thalassomonas sp. M1454 TaxID=2594477 RepID=UPI00117FC4B5|nr:potassium channel family protein [Thalassomonas sp. M1454]TRX56385.1 two pore domain potassium channel family protein [Thalassomonas sp. M1454]
MLTLTLINIVVVAAVVLLHYEVLLGLSRKLPYLHYKNKYQIVIGVFGALIAHCIEIWIFAVAYFYMLKTDRFGHFEGNFDGSLLDCAYYSFTSYTTLGFGDIAPHGAIRFFTGVESLTGLVLITWTASFLFLEMQRYWNKH